MIKLKFSLSVMVLGMLIVFLGLVLLIFAVKALSAVIGGGKKKAAPAVSAAPAPVVPAVSAAVAPAVVALGVDPEIVAVITAAIAACETNGKRLVVRAVRRSGAWGEAARRERLTY